MAYVDKPRTNTSGVYRHLAEAEEEEFERWLFCGVGKRAPQSYPRQRRLDALRLGRSVSVFANELPLQARAGRCTDMYDRVTVGVDDVVTASDENGVKAWLEENDL